MGEGESGYAFYQIILDNIRLYYFLTFNELR